MFGKKEIEAVIPQRDPFLFIDEILELKEGEWATGLWHVPEDFYITRGHFPGMPIVPGVIQVEALAQVGAFTVLSCGEYRGKCPLFAGIKAAKFRHTVYPGDTLKIEVEITRLSSVGGKGRGKAYVGDSLACEAELVFAFIELPAAQA